MTNVLPSLTIYGQISNMCFVICTIKRRNDASSLDESNNVPVVTMREQMISRLHERKERWTMTKYEDMVQAAEEGRENWIKRRDSRQMKFVYVADVIMTPRIHPLALGGFTPKLSQ